MRIFSVTPIHVGHEELARRQARYDALSPPGLTVTLRDIGEEAPVALDTEEDIRISEALVTRALREAPDGYDVLLPDCVLDPGVAALAGTLPVPVVGLLQLSLGWAVLTGRQSGAVARNKPIADEIRSRAAVYGWAPALVDVEVLDLDVHAIADGARWSAAMHDAVLRLSGRGAGAVINGCSAVTLPPAEPRTPETPQPAKPGTPETPQPAKLGTAETPQPAKPGTAETPQPAKAETPETPRTARAGRPGRVVDPTALALRLIAAGEGS